MTQETFPQLATRLAKVKESPTLAITKLASELRAAGKDILSLSAGEPDFPTPEHICEAAFAAVRAGETRYTAVDGTPALKAAVQEKFRRDNGLEFSNDAIIVSTGGKQVLYNALMASLSPGDEVVIIAPYWVSYSDMVLLAEGEPVFVETTAPDFYPRPEALEAAITPQTRWLIINNPSNPSGAFWSEDQQAALAQVLARHPQVSVLSDEIYEKMTYDGNRFVSFAKAAEKVSPEVRDRTLTVNGASKAYSMTGWRIGFAGGPRHLVRAMAKIQSQSTSNPSSVSQAAVLAALTLPEDFLAERNIAFKRRRDFVVAALNQIDGLECPTPGGAFYVYPSCAGLIGKTTPEGKTITSDADLAKYFLEAAEVAVVPGVAFGTSPYFRISYATSDEILHQACQRLSEAINKLT